ncbi:unnamed protein product [Coregonus sp. 'balchen']|nr:unnamed protein product [Coregonus sp. 'balchen']
MWLREEERQCSQEEELLSPRKMSVSRMHSLPNDSYMFPPPWEEQAPLSSLSPPPPPAPLVLTPPHIAPPRPSPRGLRRQVAVKVDSVEVQSVDSVERQDPLSTLPPLPLSLHPPPPRPPSLLSPCPPSPSSLSDPADEEVCHITSSARHWWDRHGSGRCHSLSPYASPVSPPSLRSRGSALSLLGAGLKGHDPRKGFSVDTQGFLDKPRCPDDQRRHSTEICPSPPEDPPLGEGVRGQRSREEADEPTLHLHPPPTWLTRPDYMPLPQFTFDQPEHIYVSGMSAGLSSSDPATSPSHFNRGAGFSSMNRRTAQ